MLRQTLISDYYKTLPTSRWAIFSSFEKKWQLLVRDGMISMNNFNKKEPRQPLITEYYSTVVNIKKTLVQQPITKYYYPKKV